jgi:hypothetical protein
VRRFLTYLTGFLLLQLGCREDDVVVFSPAEYFPLMVGFYQVYSIEHVVYSAFNPPLASTYEMRSEIVDAMANAEGGTTYIIHRFVRPTADDPWEYETTWSARTDGQYAIVHEENVPYVKMVFPIRVNSRWNGNRFNTLGDDEYILEQAGVTYTAGPGLTFNNSILVNQSDESNLVNKDERLEVYSVNRGLVFKESKVWSYNCTGGNCTDQIIGGYYWKQVLTSYGEN